MLTLNDPMLQNATNLKQQMIQGDYLQNNPNFDNVMNTAGRKATDHIQYSNANYNSVKPVCQVDTEVMLTARMAS